MTRTLRAVDKRVAEYRGGGHAEHFSDNEAGEVA